MPRDLRLQRRTAQQNAALATITDDDVAHAMRTAKINCTTQYQRYLNATALDEREPTDREGA